MRTISIGEGRAGGRGAGFGAGERYLVLEIFVVQESRIVLRPRRERVHFPRHQPATAYKGAFTLMQP